MRKLRCVFAMAALLAAFGLLVAVPAGQVRAEDQKDPKAAAKNKGAATVADIGTAYALIDYARRPNKENPVAMITAVEMLAGVGEGGHVKPDSEEAKMVEGGKVVEGEKYYDGLRALLKEAAGMTGGKSEAAVALAKEAAEKVDASESASKALKAGERGTAAGFTSVTVIVEHGKTVAINRLMMGNTACTTTATKVVNVGVPLTLKVVGPGNTVYTSGTMTVNWRVPKGPDTTYSIQVTNNHTADVAVRITTN